MTAGDARVEGTSKVMLLPGKGHGVPLGALEFCIFKGVMLTVRCYLENSWSYTFKMYALFYSVFNTFKQKTS